MDFGDRRRGNAILAFREEGVILHPGGGGQYGRIELPSDTDTGRSWKDGKDRDDKKSQSSLFDF